MPKKFQGENSKSATAKARKAEAKAVVDARKQKELEDALWEDNDKHVMKKEQRKVGLNSLFKTYVLKSMENHRLSGSNYLHFTFMLLAHAFIQSDLQCIQAIFFVSMCVPWELNPQPFALLMQCSTSKPQEHYDK